MVPSEEAEKRRSAAGDSTRPFTLGVYTMKFRQTGDNMSEYTILYTAMYDIIIPIGVTFQFCNESPSCRRI